jgi:surfactin synthase thioesterase subunit
LMALLLPAIRADFSVVENYAYGAGAPLDMPISVLAGKHDKHVSPASLHGWRGETSAACTTQWFDGDHFFIHTQQHAVTDCIRSALAMPQTA